jgi:TRAP-type mannitol/chloroaromatic compound transport system permease small subunit
MSLHGLSKIQTAIERFINRLGQLISWLTLVMVIVMTLVVVLRYGFNIGWIAMQESVVYMHAFVFMLGVAYTLEHDEHVRVDIFYQGFSTRKKAWVDLLGTLFILVPVCCFVFYFSFSYVISSWRLFEGSSEAGGIPGVFILKSLLLIMPSLLILQGIATAIAQVITIFGEQGEAQ